MAIIGADATECVIRGNIVGLNAAGTAALANALDGVAIADGASNNTVGGTAEAERNTISGNLLNGVRISGTDTVGNTVLGNYVGSDVTGTMDLGNSDDGVLITAGASSNLLGREDVGVGNVISGNNANGVEINGTGTTCNRLVGNTIGLDHTGTIALGNGSNGVSISNGASDNLLKGNLISGNGFVDPRFFGQGDGVSISGTSTTGTELFGNTIGLDATGTIALNNGADGVDISGASDTVLTNNVISGNQLANVAIVGGSGNRVQGNLIGTDATGTAAPLWSFFPSRSFYGLFVQNSNDNLIGGATAEARNVISNNDAGVTLDTRWATS